jgi:HD-GYP domain-containing protein (c-di-GMP phosphodiesterase class II)
VGLDLDTNINLSLSKHLQTLLILFSALILFTLPEIFETPVDRVSVGLLVLIWLGAWFANRRTNHRLGVQILVVGLTGYAVLRSISNGGLDLQATGASFLAIVLAVLYLPAFYSLLVALLSITAVGLGELGTHGLTGSGSQWISWLALAAWLAATALILIRSRRDVLSPVGQPEPGTPKLALPEFSFGNLETTPEIARVALTNLEKFVSAKGTAIFLLKSWPDLVTTLFASGTWSDWVGEQVRLSELVGMSAQDLNRLVLLPNLPAMPRYDDKGLLAGVQTLVIVPLADSQGPLGWILAGGDEPFTQAEADHLNALAAVLIGDLQRALHFEQVTQQLVQMQALMAVMQAGAQRVERDALLRTLLDQVIGLPPVEAACVRIFEPLTHTLDFVACRGYENTQFTGASVQVDASASGEAVRSRQTMIIDDPEKFQQKFPQAARQKKLRAYAAVPIIWGRRVLGVLEVFGGQSFDRYGEWIVLLENLAWQTASVWDGGLEAAEIGRSVQELTLAYDQTLEAVADVIALREGNHSRHCNRVTEITLLLARRLGVPEAELPHLRRGALLHDLGNLLVPERILHKPGELDNADWELIKQHPVFAYRLLSPVAYLQQALDIPYSHQERWDGSGYPLKLKGEAIPLAARIFAVVDVWDTLQCDRPYRRALSPELAEEHLRRMSGIQFDPRVVTVFFTLLEEGLIPTDTVQHYDSDPAEQAHHD